jgi:hypothetical protein
MINTSERARSIWLTLSGLRAMLFSILYRLMTLFSGRPKSFSIRELRERGKHRTEDTEATTGSSASRSGTSATSSERPASSPVKLAMIGVAGMIPEKGRAAKGFEGRLAFYPTIPTLAKLQEIFGNEIEINHESCMISARAFRNDLIQDAIERLHGALVSDVRWQRTALAKRFLEAGIAGWRVLLARRISILVRRLQLRGTLA